MVIAVAVHPHFPEICINDLEKNKCVKLQSTITVPPWDIEKLDEYFKEIIKITMRPIDYLYVILNRTFLNNFRKKVIELSKKYNIEHCEIVSGFKEDAIIALEFTKTWSDSIWIFNSFEHGIFCALWKINNNPKKLRDRLKFFDLKIHDICYHRRTSQGNDPSVEDLQNLKKKIEAKLFQQSMTPAIIVFRKNKEIDKKSYKSVFGNYLPIYFHKTDSFTFNFISNIRLQLVNNVNDIFGRFIEIKHDNVLLAKFNANQLTPFENKYQVFVNKNNTIIKVYENHLLTQEILLNVKGLIIVNFNIDKNGIFTINIERKITKVFYLTAKFSFKEKVENYIPERTFNIPTKLSAYDSKINAVGIDLGTSECCAFVIRKNGPDSVVLDSLTTQRTLPSFIYLADLNTPCGQTVVNKMEINPEFSVFDIKRLLGKTFSEIIIDPLWPFKVIDYYNQISLACGKMENDNLYFQTSTRLCSVLLRHIKHKVEEYQGSVLDETVITIPSSFCQKQKDATIDAAMMAEWEIVHLLPEPVAATIAYSYEKYIPDNSTFLVFDCGGGTTDICIAKVMNKKIKILDDNGDFFLGGKDFDKLLINYFNSALKHKYGVSVLKTNKRYRLMMKSREIKHTLSVYDQAELDVDDFKFEEEGVIPITRQEFEDLAIDLILRAKNLIGESLRKVSMPNENINIVFLVGGGCRMPMIKKMLLEIFPKARHECSLYPDWMVAQGAALFAYSLKKTKKLNDVK